MSPGYVTPTKPIVYDPTTIAKVDSENEKFYLKVINEMDKDIVVYSDCPPARKDETVSGTGGEASLPATWDAWNGKVKTLRGKIKDATSTTTVDAVDAWIERITIAPNNNPGKSEKPCMRIEHDGTKTGGFYVPKGHHLRMELADKNKKAGWYSTTNESKNKAVSASGKSVWITGADQYTYKNRDPLLLVEVNVNEMLKKDE